MLQKNDIPWNNLAAFVKSWCKNLVMPNSFQIPRNNQKKTLILIVPTLWKTCHLVPEIQLGLFPLLSDDRCAFLNTEGSCVLHCREWKMPFILWYGRSGNTGWENSVKKKRRHNASSLKNVFWCERGKFEALPVCSPAVGYDICTALYACSWVDLTICQRNIQVIFQPKITFHKKEAYF